MREAVVSITSRVGGGTVPSLTYEPYYGLKEKPFSLSSDPRFLYKSRAHTSVYERLRAGISRREGMVVLTGDIGTGKTTLCRSVVQGLEGRTICAFLPDPFVSREDLLKMLLIDFGVVSPNDLQNGRLNGASKAELSCLLNEFLKSLVPLQALAILVVDEAQHLSLPALEEIRILSDLEGPEKLLQVVLVGQLEFLPKLKDPQMRPFDQRISVRCHLAPLDRHGVAEYILHRLCVASGGIDRVNFSEDAIDLLYEATKGNPRLINLVCDKALQFGYLIRAFKIGPAILKQALDETGIAKLTPVTRLSEPEPLAVRGREGATAKAEVAPKIPAPVIAATKTAATEIPPNEIQLEEAQPDEAQPDEIEDDEPWVVQDSRRRRPMWIAAGLMLAAALCVAVGWPAQQGSVAAAPESSFAVAPEAPVVSAQPSAPEPSVAPNSPLAAVAGLPVEPIRTQTAAPSLGSFEVGVALFSGPNRARILMQELEAAGYRASTRTLNLARGPMFEVRTGPYSSLQAAQADAARIRQMESLGDARVVPPPTAEP